MKHNRENIIKVLNLIIENKWALNRIFKDDERSADRYFWQAIAFEEALSLITNKKRFDDLVEIYVNHNVD